MNIETIYNDFTANMLPKIQEGLQITQEYFTDLFGRYIQYLITIDSVYLIISATVFIISLILCIYLTVKGMKTYKNRESSYDDDFMIYFMFLMLPVVGMIVGGINSFYFGENLIKDIYIPEVRVYEELKGFNQN